MKLFDPSLVKPNGWKSVIGMPILRKLKRGWTLETFESILNRSILTCIEYALTQNNGIIYTTLSGGLDSSLCLAKIFWLSRNLGCEIVTVSIGRTPESPDLVHARLVAKNFYTEHHEYIPSEKEICNAKCAINTLWPDEKAELGDIAVFLTCQYFSRFQPESNVVIIHDGIDELLGGYWDHRDTDEQETVFTDYWERLASEHLLPLERKAKRFGIEVVFPYLQRSLVNYISKIPLNERTGIEESKIPLRTIARKYLPSEITNRKKSGFCDALI